MLWLQGRTSPGERPDPGDKRQSSGAGDQPAAGPDPPAAARRDGGAGGGQGPPPQRNITTCRRREHGKKRLDSSQRPTVSPKYNKGSKGLSTTFPTFPFLSSSVII